MQRTTRDGHERKKRPGASGRGRNEARSGRTLGCTSVHWPHIWRHNHRQVPSAQRVGQMMRAPRLRIILLAKVSCALERICLTEPKLLD